MFPVLKRLNEPYRWILHIRISLDIEFQFQQTILIFWTKFAQKGYFQFKTDKMNYTIEFCIFQLI